MNQLPELTKYIILSEQENETGDIVEYHFDVDLMYFVDIAKQYVLKVININYGNFFDSQMIYDIFTNELNVFMHRDSLFVSTKISLRGSISSIEYRIDLEIPLLAQKWNASLKKTLINIGKTMTRNQLVNPAFVKLSLERFLIGKTKDNENVQIIDVRRITSSLP